jgi:hypothetical protein
MQIAKRAKKHHASYVIQAVQVLARFFIAFLLLVSLDIFGHSAVTCRNAF